MFYQDILNALKAKFEGVSENVLGRIARKLEKTVTTAEQVKTAADAVTLQQLIEGYADSRATEATQTAVHNYETKYGLKDGEKTNKGGDPNPNPNPNPQQPTGGAEETPAWAKALMEQNKALTDRIAKMEDASVTADRKQRVSAIVAKLPETLRKPYERIALDTMTADEFNALATELTAEVDGIASDITAKGAVFGRPTDKGGNQGNDNTLTKEQQEAIAHRDSVAVSGEGQPF